VKTFVAKQHEMKEAWFLVDASGQTLGRIATVIAHYLRGKHRPDYTPNVLMAPNIVVKNAKNVAYTGKKGEQKIYYRHSGYPGGLKKRTLSEMLEGNHPERAIEHAVRGMLARNPLGRAMFRKLRVYAGSEHPHQAQPLQVLPLSQESEE
jgi:large subunit ribosomal protein L13